MSTPLWLSNLAAYWLQVAVVVAAGTALAAVSRLRAPRVLQAYWQGLLAACLLLPLIQPWQQVATGRVSISGASLIDVGAGAVASQLSSFPVARLIVLVLIVGIFLRSAWLALGFVKLAWLRRRARRLEPLPAAIREIQTRLGVEPDFCLSDEIPGPVTFGLRQPVILLPACFSEMDAAHQQAIAAHELLHVERRDWAFNLAEEVILTALWFHPAVWWVVNRIRLAREQVVDRDVVELTGARKPYLYALAEIAASAGTRRLFPAPTFLNESQLAQRIRTLVRENVMSKRRIVITLAAVIVLMLAAGLAIVRIFPLFAPHGADGGPVEGTVMITVAADGTVTDARLISGSLGSKALEEHALEMLKRTKLKPKTEWVGVPGVAVAEPPNDVTKPVPIYKPEVPFTQEALDAKLEGTITLQITIATDGTVSDAEVISPLGKGLDEQAVETLKTWKFKPATKNGKPVEYKLDVEISFRFF